MLPCLILMLSACAGRDIVAGVAQFEADKHCSNTSDISYLQCGTQVDDEYEKNRLLKEQQLREADEALQQEKLEQFKKSK